MKRYIRSSISLDCVIHDLEQFENMFYEPFNGHDTKSYNFIISDDALRNICTQLTSSDEYRDGSLLDQFMYKLKLYATPKCYKSIRDRLYNMLDRYYVSIPAYRPPQEALTDLVGFISSTQNKLPYRIRIEQRPSSVCIHLLLSKKEMLAVSPDEFEEIISDYMDYLEASSRVAIDTRLVHVMSDLDHYKTYPNSYKPGSIYIQVLPTKL